MNRNSEIIQRNSDERLREKNRFATNCAYAAASKSGFSIFGQSYNRVWQQTFSDAFQNPEKYTNNILDL